MAGSSRYTSNKARQLGYRSGLEVKTSVQLEGRTFEYETEKCKFVYWTPVTKGGIIDKDGVEVLKLDKGAKIIQWRTYTCDFMITKSCGQPMFIETKGLFSGKDRVKHKQLKKLYPDTDLRIIFQNDGKVSSKTRYSQWAEKEGITYHVLTAAQKRNGNIIPEEWLDV